MSYVPDQGDIILLDFDPSSGREIMKRRPALVISKKAFNRHTGFAVVAPVTSTIRGVSLEVELPGRLTTSGAVLVYQLKSVDFAQRKASFVEKMPKDLVKRAVDIAQAIVA